jgi:predicted DCC family thiol-disulfide oxidoreductase YuxK
MSDYSVEMFYDGECPLCRREVDMLRRFDRKSRIRFTDIAASGFDPSPLGLTYQRMMASIHGRLPTGQVIEGVEVFRQAYAAIGLGPLIAATRLPGIRQLLDASYELFAKNRLRLTGRCEAGHCDVAGHASHGPTASHRPR